MRDAAGRARPYIPAAVQCQGKDIVIRQCGVGGINSRPDRSVIFGEAGARSLSTIFRCGQRREP